MKPPSFLYACPRSLDESLALLAEHGEGAKLLAGGQSLVPLLNLRLAEPRVLIDLNRLSELSYVRRDGGALRIGAMTRHRDLEISAVVAVAEPLLARAAREIGHLAIRNRGTIGGSLAHADPAAEWPLVAVALDAQLTLRSVAGARTMAARDFFVGPLTTALEPTEMLTEVAFPAAPPDSGFGFSELSRRPGDFAIVAVACRVVRDESGACRASTLAVGGAHGTPIHVAEVEGILRGSHGEADALRSAAEAVTRRVDPGSDVHGSADYRRRMAGVLARRALGEACAVPA
ncbi:MAG: xanthine dehydrogenase family protein subunit M [Candidatus Binatia bacterium]